MSDSQNSGENNDQLRLEYFYKSGLLSNFGFVFSDRYQKGRLVRLLSRLIDSYSEPNKITYLQDCRLTKQPDKQVWKIGRTTRRNESRVDEIEKRYPVKVIASYGKRAYLEEEHIFAETELKRRFKHLQFRGDGFENTDEFFDDHGQDVILSYVRDKIGFVKI